MPAEHFVKVHDAAPLAARLTELLYKAMLQPSKHTVEAVQAGAAALTAAPVRVLSMVSSSGVLPGGDFWRSWIRIGD